MDGSNLGSSPVKPTMKLEKHGEEDQVDITLSKQIVGSLRYVCNSRPDKGFSVGLISKYRMKRICHTRRLQEES